MGDLGFWALAHEHPEHLALVAHEGRGVDAEVVGLPGHGPQPAHLPEQPFGDGDLFEDVSVVAYQVRQGRIVRADAIHTNPGSIQKAMRGSGDQAAAGWAWA